jgi:DNA-binding GntR family transcriptional regulator
VAGPDASVAPLLSVTPIPEAASRSERAYLWLREQIITAKLPPGALIRESGLMDELAMSRTPIREALLRLTQENLVVVVGRRGTFVSDVNVGDVGLIYEFRREFESIAARWAATRRTAEDVPRIERVIEDLRLVPAHPPPSADTRVQILEAQKAHALVYELCGNRFLREVLTSHYLHTVRIWFLASGRVNMDEPETLLIDELEAIIAGDPDAAADAARRHLTSAEAAVRAAL